MTELMFIVAGALGLIWVLHGGRPVAERAGAWVPGKCGECGDVWPYHQAGCSKAGR